MPTTAHKTLQYIHPTESEEIKEAHKEIIRKAKNTNTDFNKLLDEQKSSFDKISNKYKEYRDSINQRIDDQQKQEREAATKIQKIIRGKQARKISAEKRNVKNNQELPVEYPQATEQDNARYQLIKQYSQEMKKLIEKQEKEMSDIPPEAQDDFRKIHTEEEAALKNIHNDAIDNGLPAAQSPEELTKLLDEQKNRFYQILQDTSETKKSILDAFTEQKQKEKEYKELLQQATQAEQDAANADEQKKAQDRIIFLQNEQEKSKKQFKKKRSKLLQKLTKKTSKSLTKIARKELNKTTKHDKSKTEDKKMDGGDASFDFNKYNTPPAKTPSSKHTAQGSSSSSKSSEPTITPNSNAKDGKSSIDLRHKTHDSDTDSQSHIRKKADPKKLKLALELAYYLQRKSLIKALQLSIHLSQRERPLVTALRLSMHLHKKQNPLLTALKLSMHLTKGA